MEKIDAKEFFTAQLKRLEEDDCRTFQYLDNCSGTLTLEIDKCAHYLDDFSVLLDKPFDALCYKIPSFNAYIPTDVEYSLKNLATLKAVIMSRFYKIKDVIFQQKVTYTREIHV
jgi:hypothetical protein